MTFVADETESQPELWRRAAVVARENARLLPQAGARTAVFA
jgi:hypothetical protein